jgi:transglutaminase-like putative cysteine protease
MARTFDNILEDARRELRDRWVNYRDEFYQGEPHDVIHEIADSSVPIYYSDLFESWEEIKREAGDDNEDGDES